LSGKGLEGRVKGVGVKRVRGGWSDWRVGPSAPQPPEVISFKNINIHLHVFINLYIYKHTYTYTYTYMDIWIDIYFPKHAIYIHDDDDVYLE
jgi:hypothetical protein